MPCCRKAMVVVGVVKLLFVIIWYSIDKYFFFCNIYHKIGIYFIMKNGKEYKRPELLTQAFYYFEIIMKFKG